MRLEKTILTNLTDDSALLTLLDSKIPQSVIIKNVSLPSSIKVLVVDSVVRNKLTNMRFIQLKVFNNHADWRTKEYISPKKEIIEIANNVLSDNKNKLTNSFLTTRQINSLAN
jgi:hypothetical protein